MSAKSPWTFGISNLSRVLCRYTKQIQFQLTVCSYHVTYAFQSESTLCSCLNVKELLARSRSEIWSLSDCNWARTHNHLVHKQTLNHLVKLFVYELSGCGFKSSCSHLNTILFVTCHYAVKLPLYCNISLNSVAIF